MSFQERLKELRGQFALPKVSEERVVELAVEIKSLEELAKENLLPILSQVRTGLLERVDETRIHLESPDPRATIERMERLKRGVPKICLVLSWGEWNVAVGNKIHSWGGYELILTLDGDHYVEVMGGGLEIPSVRFSLNSENFQQRLEKSVLSILEDPENVRLEEKYSYN